MKTLSDYLAAFYRPEEYPALNAQIKRWSRERPFSGLRILDATPAYRNTMVKYRALLAAGAELSVFHGKGAFGDPDIFAMLPGFGIPLSDGKEGSFDLIADCAGVCRELSPRLGFVELTRSGLPYYETSSHPVFSADSGILKKLETALGTGDGFIRGMVHFGFPLLPGKKVLVWGGGKVGRGIAFAAGKAGAEVTVADRRPLRLPEKFSFVNVLAKKEVEKAIENAWCIAAVTGCRSALAPWVPLLRDSGAILVNMGAEDEFGDLMPPERVLNGKRPLNFALEEPTLLRYIDASMALDNRGLEMLLSGKLPAGITFPPPEIEREILQEIRQNGLIPAAELELLIQQKGIFQNV